MGAGEAPPPPADPDSIPSWGLACWPFAMHRWKAPRQNFLFPPEEISLTSLPARWAGQPWAPSFSYQCLQRGLWELFSESRGAALFTAGKFRQTDRLRDERCLPRPSPTAETWGSASKACSLRTVWTREVGAPTGRVQHLESVPAGRGPGGLTGHPQAQPPFQKHPDRGAGVTCEGPWAQESWVGLCT